MVMMTLPELSLAVLALLLTPGPTNTLMLLAGAERGFAGALRLIPAELAGYFLTVLPLVLVGAMIIAPYPAVQTAVVLGAGLWVAWLAIRLWRVPVSEAPVGVGANVLFVTTALNPKALIFGLVLLPSPDHLALNLGLFAGLVIAVAALWAGAGALLRNRGQDRPRFLLVFRRLASVWLAAVSVTLLLRGVTA